MKYGFWKIIKSWFSSTKRALVVSDETENLKMGVRLVKRAGFKIHGYGDYKKALLRLNCRDSGYYHVAYIFRNGSVTKAESMRRFIQDYNPKIQTFIFENESDLKNKISNTI